MPEIMDEMGNESLVDLLEKVIIAWHYDPHNNYEEYMRYDVDMLKKEIVSRMGRAKNEKNT